jgi:hypothetical protein
VKNAILFSVAHADRETGSEAVFSEFIDAKQWKKYHQIAKETNAIQEADENIKLWRK